MRRNDMNNTRAHVKSVLLCAALTAVAVSTVSAQSQATRLANSFITGTVQGEKGPEAGVWVIAETKDLLTNFIKIVVTDDRGRFLVPDLPKANYKVWVRGYGLVDSPTVQAAPGAELNLTAKIAPDARSAAQYYPAEYWYSLVKLPAKGEFPGTGPSG